MRNIPTLLKQDIEAGFIARLLKITCKDGTVASFTDHDQVLVVDGDTYESTPGLAQISYTATSTVEVSSQTTSAATVDLPESDILAGKYDDAVVEASWASWLNPAYGKVVIFLGAIADLQYNETGFEAEVMSFMKRLELNIGQVYTASCRHVLYGQQEVGKVGFCGVSASAFSFTGTVASIITNRWKFTLSGAAAGKADGYFSNGKVTFSSGQNSGVDAIVKKHTGDTIELMLPTGRILAIGDTFTIMAGCDKSTDMCKAKFNNLLNYGGYPHINTGVNYR